MVTKLTKLTKVMCDDICPNRMKLYENHFCPNDMKCESDLILTKQKKK